MRRATAEPARLGRTHGSLRSRHARLRAHAAGRAKLRQRRHGPARSHGANGSRQEYRTCATWSASLGDRIVNASLLYTDKSLRICINPIEATRPRIKPSFAKQSGDKQVRPHDGKRTIPEILDDAMFASIPRDQRMKTQRFFERMWGRAHVSSPTVWFESATRLVPAHGGRRLGQLGHFNAPSALLYFRSS